MINKYEAVIAALVREPKVWLVTGVAGFIGSNLLQQLLCMGQKVIGLDNFATGYQRNLDEVEASVTVAQWSRFTMLRGDIRNLDDCSRACVGVDYVLHQAALGSVPRSINDPVTTNSVNIGGFLNILIAARDAGVQSFTYAASSSTYGDHPGLPKVENVIGKPLSPYAITKYVNELYAENFATTYGFHTIGLRYFNVFGPRQDPNGAYAAVIPKWTSAMLSGEAIYINGDGETSRDYCFVGNAVQANILAATSDTDARNQVYNVAVNDRTSLNLLFALLRSNVESYSCWPIGEPVYRAFRAGDVRHSMADIGKATRLLGYKPTHTLATGLGEAVPWYVAAEARKATLVEDSARSGACSAV